MKELDKKSLENAKNLYESGKIDSIELGTTKGLQEIHYHLFKNLYDFAGKIRDKTLQKAIFALQTLYILKKFFLLLTQCLIIILKKL